MQEFISQKLPEVRALFSKNKVERAYLFGSACTEHFRSDSDVDVLIKFQDGISAETYTDSYFLLAEELGKLFERKVDLLTETSLSNPYFIKIGRASCRERVCMLV